MAVNRLTQEESVNKIKTIVKKLKENIGYYAILTIRKRNKYTPYLIKIKLSGNKFLGEYKTYKENGEYNATLVQTIRPEDLISEEQKIYFLHEK